jgi:hypothetical protein
MKRRFETKMVAKTAGTAIVAALTYLGDVTQTAKTAGTAILAVLTYLGDVTQTAKSAGTVTIMFACLPS